MGLVVQHGGGQGVGELRDEVLADDHQGDTCGGQVLLCAGKEDAEPADVHRLAQDAAGGVRHQRNVGAVGALAHLREGGPLGSHDGVVQCDVAVVVVPLNPVDLRNEGVAVVLGGGDDIHRQVLLGLLDGLVGPDAGVDVGRLPQLLQVHGNHGELGAGSALQEEDGVVVRNAHQPADPCLRILDDGLVVLGAMAHLHDRLAGALIVQHLGGGFLQH